MINNHSLFWQNKCFSLISRMIGDGGCIFNIFVMLIHALLSCHTAFSVCIRRPLPVLATVVNDNLRIALRQKSFFSRDNETTLHKLIQMLLKTPTIVSIPNSLAKQRKVLIQVLSYDHWFYLHRKLFVSGPNLMSRRMQGLDECFDCPTSFKPVFVFVSNANNSAAN